MRLPTLLLMATALVSAGCGPAVDLSKALEVNVMSTGWYDAGIVNGKNKLVPSITFTVKNVSDQKLVMLQVNGVFRRAIQMEEPELGSAFGTAAGSSGLVPGATSPVLTLRSGFGYTGTDPRADMLNNKQFIDGRVELFAKYSSTQWKLLGVFPIERQLILH
jgi:hypothetical protein